MTDADSKKVVAAIDPIHARTHALNVEGVFFQQRVADVVRQAGWIVKAQEYPVAYPKGNGPILGREGRLDILAERIFEDYRTILAIECKKADQDYKDWVFFPKESSQPIKAGMVSPRKRENAPETATGLAKWEIQAGVVSFVTGPVCVDSRELKAEYGKPDSWKSSTKRIDDACYQATQAVQALVNELLSRQSLLLSNAREPEITSWIIPIVVTTANVAICRFQPQDISLDTGEIDWTKVKYEAADVTALEYPLPVHLQFSPARPLELDPNDTETFTKKHVFVVRGMSLYDFLQRADLGTRIA